MLADIRFSLRNLRKSPMFTTIAILSIALGIGANTAIFTLFDHLLLRLLPVRDAAELVYLKVSGPFSGSVFGANVFSYAQYQEIRKGNPVFSGVTAFLSAAVSFSNGTQTQRARAELVSGNYFEVMGLSPAAGRLLTDADDQVRGGHPPLRGAGGRGQPLSETERAHVHGGGDRAARLSGIVDRHRHRPVCSAGDEESDHAHLGPGR
jgi:putative ABC transport system permease protein